MLGRARVSQTFGVIASWHDSALPVAYDGFDEGGFYNLKAISPSHWGLDDNDSPFL